MPQQFGIINQWKGWRWKVFDYAIFSDNPLSLPLCQKFLMWQYPAFARDALRIRNELHTLLCYFAWPSVTFAGAQALVNRLTSGTWSTVEIIRKRSGINWVWLRTLFKGTPFSPLDIIGDHSEGGGGGRGAGFDGWRQLLVFAPVTCHSNSTPSLALHICLQHKPANMSMGSFCIHCID